MTTHSDEDLKDIAAEAISEEENDQLWAEEAERRYAAYKTGTIESVPAEEVFARLRSRKR